ncbi:centrosomal protein kizuna isoform X2 [Piliocolobus tephrosceles]|uniref:centrosomal protein kizuna isoform X2 n=1 Tax=Piliocolobus tephrosceles TaxID=591936 RepID=UPI000E6AFA3C|nr:centrosomal protein kizuna isoform X2 [Piliocolobus tephrosceles]
MNWTHASSVPLSSPEYYERVSQLQQRLRESEKKRLDLEKKLYEYHQSETYRVKLKYVKLKNYLKEICESEKKAHARNQEYLKQFERFQAHAVYFTTNTEKLQKLKPTTAPGIPRSLPSKYETGPTLLSLQDQMRASVFRVLEYETQIKKMLLSKDSLGLKGELKDEDREKIAMQEGINSGTAMSRGLYQPATIFMGRQMSAVSSMGDFSTEHKSPQPTKNFSIPDPHSHRQIAQRSNVTDSCVVQTSNDTQCLNKSDSIDGKASLQIGEKTPVTASVLSEEEHTHCLEIGSNTRHGKSNLSEGKKSAELNSPLQERLSPENRTTDLKCDSSSRSEGSEGEILTREHIEVEEKRASPPVSPISVSEYCESENKWSQEKHSPWEGVSDHLAHGDPKSQKPFRKKQEEKEEESWSTSSDLTVSISEDDLFLKSPEPQPNPGGKMEREDGIEALKLIHAEQERDALSTEKNNCILQTLSSPDSEKESSTNAPTREPGQAPDSGVPRAPVGQHVATLKKHDNSLKEEATALLRKALTEECGHRSAIHSSESSCSLPSILNDSSGIKEAKPAVWLNSVPTREQETEAYQLLKKATLQDNTNQTENRFQKADASVSHLSGLNIGSGAFETKTANKIASEASFSSSEGSPLSRHENKKKPMIKLKSNALWDESDDSNSEIEAALRPRNHNTDDSDDFYD